MGDVDRNIMNWKSWREKRWLPWMITGVTLLAVVVVEIFRPSGVVDSTLLNQIVLGSLVVLGLGLIYLTVNSFSNLLAGRKQLEDRLNETEQRVGEAYQRLEALFRVSQKFVEANDENEVIEPVLRLLVTLTGARGASFVPIDEHGQPQTALSQGELDAPVMEAWAEYLVSPEVRNRCMTCENRDQFEKPATCPLLKGPFAGSGGLVCIPVHRGEREYGVLSIFLDAADSLDDRQRIYLRALVDEMALGLEGVSLRRRELSVLRQIQVLRKRADLNTLLNGLLDNVFQTLEADFAMMLVPRAAQYQAKIDLSLGELPGSRRPFIDGIMQGVMTSGEPLLLGDVSGSQENGDLPSPFLRSLIAAPLLSPDRTVLGTLMVGSQRARSFHQRQLTLLQTIAGQVALVVQNASLMAELEFQSMIQERARLAREIHDGLAQTIGFLKLQASQLRGMLKRGDIERAEQAVDLYYATLSEAYQDARQAIDGLRISPDECGINGWLQQTSDEFSELSGLKVRTDFAPVDSVVAPEIQAQLVRIMQEALSNVRKHAHAQQVWVACTETQDDLLLEVRDDGLGFSPEDVSSASRHGLRSMRERADLIGADFQVISRPHEGTIVRLRLPVNHLQESIR
jgi:two-component system nitrate/nitrite sensor histidine kinase NarX